MPSYTTLESCRRQLAQDSSVTVDNNIIADDFIQQCSQTIEDICGKNFDDRIATYGFNGEVGSNNPTLFLDDIPLLSVDSITNGDGSALASTAYDLLPKYKYPKTSIRIAQNNYWTGPAAVMTGAGFGYYPALNSEYAKDAIVITGHWGFHRNYAKAWKLLTITGTVADTSTGTLTLSAAGALDVGSVLKAVKADNTFEFLRVTGPTTGISTATSISVERAYNGSTAYAHTASTLYIWQVEPIIEWATRETVASAYKSRYNASGQQFNPGGIGTITVADVPAKVLEKLQWPYFSYDSGVQIR